MSTSRQIRRFQIRKLRTRPFRKRFLPVYPNRIYRARLSRRWCNWLTQTRRIIRICGCMSRLFRVIVLSCYRVIVYRVSCIVYRVSCYRVSCYRVIVLSFFRLVRPRDVFFGVASPFRKVSFDYISTLLLSLHLSAKASVEFNLTSFNYKLSVLTALKIRSNGSKNPIVTSLKIVTRFGGWWRHRRRH